MLLSELRATVTGASVDYVGSVTIHEELCDALGLLDRQMVHIRNHSSNNSSSATVDLWTYVIRGMDCLERCPPGTVCLNGAAAHLVNVGDIVTLTARGLVTAPVSDESTTLARSIVPRRWDAVQDGVTNVIARMGGAPSDAWAAEAVLEYACGKVHRPRITHVVEAHTTAINTGTTNDNHTNNKIDSNNASNFPALVLDSNWAREGSIHEGEAIHLVNVTNGQRDIVTAQYAPAGSQQCAIHNIATSRTNNVGSSNNNDNNNNDKDARPGYSVGDVVIAMTYGSIARGAVMEGKAPPMRICFPFERPVYMTTVSSKTNNESTAKAKPFVGTASPSSPTSTCSESSSSSSSSSQGSNDGQQQQQQQEGHVDLHTLWDHSAKLKQQQELLL